MGNITNLAIIVAGGTGERVGGEIPKVYRQLSPSRSVLATTLEQFLQNDDIGAVLVVINKLHIELYESTIKQLNNKDKLLEYVIGGATRQHSVFAGLQAAVAHNPAQVLIHDAARPYAKQSLINRCIAALGSAAAVVPAVSPRDSVKTSENGEIASVPRESVFLAQTPQGFHFAALLAAYQQIPDSILATLTDDAAVAEMAGMPQALVAGEESNIKLTYASDFPPAAPLAKTGFGYDVHRFGAEGSAASITLCGVEISHNAEIIGYSDADVALHALTDAVLGAIAEGDIGLHFSPSDAANRDRASSEFLAFALELAGQKGAVLTHIDITIVCETPKITPHREAMQKRLAELTGLSTNSISIKSTTTEKLREGLECYAVVNMLII